MTIRNRLLLALVPTILLLFGFVVYISFKISEETVLKQIDQDVFDVAYSYAQEFDVLTESSRKVAEGMAITLGTVPELKDSFIKNLIKNNVEQNSIIYGSTVAFDPHKTHLGHYSPYFYRSTNGIKYKSLAKPSYDYTKWDWFRIPMGTGKGSWGEPYFDIYGGERLMITYSAPITRNKNQVGIATVDITLNEFVNKVKSLKVGYTGYAFIVSRKGCYITHPKKELLSGESIWGDWKELNDPNLKTLSNLIEAQKQGSVQLDDPFTGKSSWVVVMPIKSTGWTLVIMYPSDEILQPLIRLRHAVVLLSVIIVGLLIIVILWILTRATSPISKLVKQTEQYAAGNFKGRLDDTRGSKEIQKLSCAFNVMGKAIDQKIQELHNTQLEIVYHLGRAAEYRDTDTGLHIKRMSHYCAVLGHDYGMSKEDCNLLLHASPMHDIGKIGIPDFILLKKGKHDPDEWKTMKTHCSIGERILSGNESRLLEMAQVIAFTHHEKWDGSGYPLGLKGEEIPLVGRITHLCDIFDSLTSRRPYKRAWTVEEAMKEIRGGSGKDTDPQLVELFEKILPDILKIKERFDKSESNS